MKVWVSIVACVVCVAFAGDARAQSSCAEALKGSDGLESAGEERIEGGTKCYVKAKGSGNDTRSVHTIIWDPPIIESKDPPKQDPPKQGPPKQDPQKPCAPTEPQLIDMWKDLNAARAQARDRVTDKFKLADGNTTIGVAYILDDKCTFVTKAIGEYVGKKHAEQLIIEQLEPTQPLGKRIGKGSTVWWLIDQQPCKKPKPRPREGYCTDNLKAFARTRKVGQRVFAVADVKTTGDKKKLGDPKEFAISGKTPTGENFIELRGLTYVSK